MIYFILTLQYSLTNVVLHLLSHQIQFRIFDPKVTFLIKIALTISKILLKT